MGRGALVADLTMEVELLFGCEGLSKTWFAPVSAYKTLPNSTESLIHQAGVNGLFRA